MHAQPDDSPLVQQGIAKRLLRSVLLAISLVLALTFLLQAYVAYERSAYVLKNDLQQYAQMSAPTFDKALWNLDYPQIHQNIAGLLLGPNVYGVVIRDNIGKELAALGSILYADGSLNCHIVAEYFSVNRQFDQTKCLKNSSSYIQATENILHDGQILGTVTLYSSLDRVGVMMQPIITAMLVSAAFILVALSVVCLWVIKRQVGQPLQLLTNLVSAVDYSQRSSTAIAAHFIERKDELSTLSHAFETMVLRLIYYQNHLEDIVDERTENLRIANAAKSDFFSHMSHEIRTPINGVLGLSELMLQEDMNEELKGYTEMIYSSGEHLLKIVNNILDLSKIEAGKLQLEKIPVSLHEIAGESQSLFNCILLKSGVTFHTKIDNALPASVYADPLRLKQILINLIGNAAKVTEQGTITLLIETTPEAKIKFSVSDTGIGMSDTHQQGLFTAFHQADKSTTRQYGGTGLGLTICKQLIELMGGNISVSSTPQQGSCFSFVLPLPAVAPASPQRLSLDTRFQAHFLEGIAVLVAEDNKVNQTLIIAVLKKLGAEATVVANGLLAVEHCQAASKKIDLIIMDCEMPVMDGWEATQTLRNMNMLRENGEPIIVIGLSAHAIEGSNQRAHAAGMDDYITKPLVINTLVHALQQQDLLAR
jgi:signal transduction histidine kinase